MQIRGYWLYIHADEIGIEIERRAQFDLLELFGQVKQIALVGRLNGVLVRVALDARIGAVLQQYVHNVRTISPYCQMKRRIQILILYVELSTSINQRLHHLVMAVLCFVCF